MKKNNNSKQFLASGNLACSSLVALKKPNCNAFGEIPVVSYSIVSRTDNVIVILIQRDIACVLNVQEQLTIEGEARHQITF